MATGGASGEPSAASGVVVLRVRGVPVRVGWSWTVIVVLVYWSLAGALFPSGYPGLATWQYAVMAGVATVLLFVSLLLHEISHTLQSLREGVHVQEISLWLFGGVSRADEPIPSPAAELRVVAAGPLVTAVLMLVFGAAAATADLAGASDPVVGVLTYLARINGLLLVFNLVPALPLDGGRLLHALLWRRSGDQERATLVAAGAGRIFAALLIGVGAVLAFARDSVGGVWFVLIGLFLHQAVRQEEYAAKAVRAFRGLRVGDVMAAPAVSLPPEMTVADLAGRLDDLADHGAYPVVSGGCYVGTLLLSRAGEVPEDRRPLVRVGELMAPSGALPTVHVDDDLNDVVRDLGEVLSSRDQDVPHSVVVLGGATGAEPVGVLALVDLERTLERVRGSRGGRRRGA